MNFAALVIRKMCIDETSPGETFRVLKEKEMHQFSECRTCRLVLEAWNKFEKKSDGINLSEDMRCQV